jgi:hypothetical protein
LCYL